MNFKPILLLVLIYVLPNIFTCATDLPDECMVCYEYFPVFFQFSCGHELCVLCAESILKVCDHNNCPKCRSPLPQFVSEWIAMIHIDTIRLTPDIPLAKLQHIFPLICSVANLTTVIKCVNMGVDVNTKGFFGYFPVHLASQKNVIQYLVDKAADVNQIDNTFGDTPLILSSRNGNLPVVEFLVKNGADVNQGNRYKLSDDGCTPLIVSSHKGHLSIVQFLVENGADVNQVDSDGVSPLTIAMYKNQTEVVKFLLKKNANIETTKLTFKKTKLSNLIGILNKLCKEIKEYK